MAACIIFEGFHLCRPRNFTDALLKRIREVKPLVQCIISCVSMDMVSNVLLAIGASPAVVKHIQFSASPVKPATIP